MPDWKKQSPSLVLARRVYRDRRPAIARLCCVADSCSPARRRAPRKAEDQRDVALSTNASDTRSVPIPYHVDQVSSLQDRKSTRLNSSHSQISYAVFCLKKKNVTQSD